MNRLDFLIDYLINEDPQCSEMRIPEDLQGKRDLFRALRNVREPKPVSEEFLRLQDEELQAQLQEEGVVELDAVQQLSILNYQFSYGRATSPVSAWTPSSTPPMRRCWVVSIRCTNASTTPSIPLRACSCARSVTN